jgi:hypothetical protein
MSNKEGKGSKRDGNSNKEGKGMLVNILKT